MITCGIIIHINSVVAPSIALFRCFMYVIILSNYKVKHDKYCTSFTLFSTICIVCIMNVVVVVVVVEINFNSIKKNYIYLLQNIHIVPHMGLVLGYSPGAHCLFV